MVQWLLARGVTDINTPNFEKKTALKVAIERGHNEVAELLRANGGTE
jgi:hypothetical protein